MTRLKLLAAAALAGLLSATAGANTAQDARMNDAISVVREFTEIPEQAIPGTLLRNAEAIAVIPGMIKAGFVVGGRWGQGVLLVRQDDGSWSSPGFIKLGGGSLGWQIGVQSTDIILVFKDRRSISNIYTSKLTLGGDASAAAGPVGRQTSAATDELFRAEIYSYARSRGLFLGVSLEGSWLGMDHAANEAYYGSGIAAEQILSNGISSAPLNAARLVEIMASAAPNSGTISRTPRTSVAESSSVIVEPDPAPEVYSLEPLEPLGDLEMGGDETMF
jgi:lipid-binding SYLF domain-containing protein